MRAVVVLPDPDPGFNKMRTQRARRYLQPVAVERHGVVVANLTLLLNAEDLVQIDPGDRDERGTFLFGFHREPGIVRRDVNIVDERVGRLTVVIPASASSLTKRSCNVWNTRSDR